MRIAMLSPVGPAHGRGGVQDIVRSLCAGLAARGHDVTLVSTGRASGPAREVLDGFAAEYLAGVPAGRAIGAWSAASREAVARLHAAAPLDAIHSQSFCGLHLAGAFPGVAVTASLHGTHVDELRTYAGLVRESLPGAPLVAARNAARWGYMAVRFLREGPGLRRAEAVIATSTEQRRVLLERYGVAPERLHDVWNGIDARLFSPREADPARRAALLGGRAGPLVLAVARLYQDKGLQHAIRGWRALLALQPGATLVIVGDGPYRATLESLARHEGVADAVRITGFVPLEDLPAHYAACDAFVNPTVRINGYDLTILQAMAHAKPVVVSNIDSVPTAVHDGGDGVLVPPGDPVAFAEALAALLSDAPRAARLGAEARRTIEARFSLDAMVEGTLAVYGRAREARRA